MAGERQLNRREFIATTSGAAAAAAVLPRRVLGGPGRVAPSDRINVALIGSGTQALRQLMSDWLPREDLSLVAVCDPNTDSDDYRDWSPHGIRNSVRRFLNNPNWGSETGIRAGLMAGQELIEGYYANERAEGDWNGLKLYADYREMLAESEDVDAVIDMTPEHLHGVVNIAGMKAGKAVISHKVLANTLHEVHHTVRVAKETGVTTHLMAWNNDPGLYQLWEWLDQGIIGKVKEVHNWSNRPVWPQGWMENPKEAMPIPEGLDWSLWLGCVPDRPYHLDYTHALFRGWFEFGSGCLGDMGQYSLWRTYRMLNPGPVVSVQANAATGAVIVGNQSQWRRSEVAFPSASTVHFEHKDLDIFWYDGGMKPRVPNGLLAPGERLPREGVLYIGEYGTIMGNNFLATDFRLLPDSRMTALQGSMPAARPAEEVKGSVDEYVDAIREGKQSRGSFINIADLAEATCLATIALRTGEHISWDAENMKVTGENIPHELMTREYRDGWAV
ncbi:MAG: Gfo/Idh/MocA family oxidoreductase [Rhodothermaceae bacterium]|nr:Gfo/Idh/MocA family oxidoreductase [Rhodothermaceae bacterium]MXX57905.1 Gfo/Idh/MocA family oxidoreductase [Rhodothermaceae bacterium]MYD18916.1 Gfo/Idh/MocA family oxidoreductase [Rhodothermaceae bacterium]MYD56922.1 Gfo/Idh/MocA family oxidoreductase [Rhodothermaceae bacterium]MYI44400.1 Gfo/Idh/MocA family oxidoreductase [Rhodothermaceae bacterium]